MSSYVVLVRVEGVRPHRMPRVADRREPTIRQHVPETVGGARMQDERRTGPTVAERIDRAREIWAQTTFYLFDPESWR